MRDLARKIRIAAESKGLKEKSQVEQIEKYEQARRAHMFFRLNGFESAEGTAILKETEL